MKKLLVTSYLLLVIGLILPSIWPLFHAGFFRLHDYTHVARLHQLDKALNDGHFPVRWVKDLGWGFGMPVFNFYAPLPYYLAEAFHLIGFSFLNSIKIIFALTAFTSFLGMFLLAKKFWGKWGGILAAIAFVYSPYRAVDFYVRGALGELFAISLIPWVLWAITEVIDKNPKVKIVAFSLILGLFLLSHTVLNLICLPLFLVFGFFYLLINKANKASLARLFFGFVLGLSLASFFLLPAFIEKRFTQVDKLISGYSHYSHHFLYFRQFLGGRWGYGGSVDGINDGMSFHLGKGHLLLASITLIFSFTRAILKKRLEKRTLLTIFLLALALILAVLSTYHSKLIWDAIPLMAYIQFPWRFNSFIIVLVAFLAGGTCFYLKQFLGKKGVFLFLLTSLIMLVKVNVRYFQPQIYVKASEYYYTDEESIKRSMSGIIPDYIPIWVEGEPGKISQKDYQVLSGSLKIDQIKAKTHKLSIKGYSERESKIQLNRFYFPGWQLVINGQEKELDYKDNNGIIYTMLPKGEFFLKLRFQNTLIRSLANLISLFSLFVIGIMFFRYGKKI